MGQYLLAKHFAHSVKKDSADEFQDNDTLYRLLLDDESNALNANVSSDCEPRPGNSDICQWSKDYQIAPPSGSHHPVMPSVSRQKCQAKDKFIFAIFASQTISQVHDNASYIGKKTFAVEVFL